jgi:hypothetical protein
MWSRGSTKPNALNERTKALQMGSVEILRAADRHAHAVQRYRVVTADSFQCMMRRTAGAHIVFGMDLEETVLPTLGEDCGQMFMLEARAGEPGDRMGWKAKTPFYAWRLKLDHSIHCVFSFHPISRLTLIGRASQRRERTRATARHLNARAGVVRNELPRIALEVDG